jgi:ferredoxin
MSIRLDGDVCVLCGLCVGVCPPGALRLLPTELEVSPRCNECGLCVPYCPVGALSGGRYRPQRFRQ